jgi:hypothetical protein
MATRSAIPSDGPHRLLLLPTAAAVGSVGGWDMTPMTREDADGNADGNVDGSGTGDFDELSGWRDPSRYATPPQGQDHWRHIHKHLLS